MQYIAIFSFKKTPTDKKATLLNGEFMMIVSADTPEQATERLKPAVAAMQDNRGFFSGNEAACDVYLEDLYEMTEFPNKAAVIHYSLSEQDSRNGRIYSYPAPDDICTTYGFGEQHNDGSITDDIFITWPPRGQAKEPFAPNKPSNKKSDAEHPGKILPFRRSNPSDKDKRGKG
jgi:hypothetical protein